MQVIDDDISEADSKVSNINALSFDRFVDEKTGFSIDYPEGWSIDEIMRPDSKETRVIFTGSILGINGEILLSYGKTYSYSEWFSVLNSPKTNSRLVTIDESKTRNGMKYDIFEAISEDNEIIWCIFDSYSVSNKAVFTDKPEVDDTKEILQDSSLRNPSWEELKAFLWKDKTDQKEYVFPTFVCEDFARTLQSNAKKAGLRCAFANVKLKGYPDWFNYGIPPNTGHGLNAFETTDRGLVYIDCTGLPSGFGGPGNCDKIIDVKIGGEYIPRSVFPDLLGWRWVNMGTIVDIDIIQW